MHHARSLPLRVLFYPARHVRWRIIAPYAVLTVLLAAGGAFLITRLVASSLQERFDNQLAQASRVASDAVVRRESKHLETVRAVAFTEGMAAATEAGGGAAVQRLAEPLAANHHDDLIEVLNADGRRVYGARLNPDQSLSYTALADEDDRALWPIVQKVIMGRSDSLGDKYAGIVTSNGADALYTAGPIYNGDRLAGVVLVGTPLSALVLDVKNQALADVSIYEASGAPLGSTLAAESGGLGDELRPAPGVLATDRGPVREHKELSERGYDLLYADLTVRGERVGVISVALPSRFVLSAAIATRTELVVLFSLATLAVLGIGWLISRTITAPVFRIVAAARAVTDGDLTARSGVAGDDEIGAFGVAFDAMTDRLQRQHLATIGALASAIDARDPYTMGHSLRVGQLAVEVGREMDVSAAQLQDLEVGGYLHDIGKIGIRDSVLLKSGALTDEERHVIEQHPRIGLDILAPVELTREVIAFVGGHHEKLDGSGYPGRLHGDAIGLVPRIATVADIYDAITTDRPYRPGMSPQQALDILDREVAGGKVDERAVAALRRALPRWRQRLEHEPRLAGVRFDVEAAGDAA